MGYDVYECRECRVGLTNRDPEKQTCENCGERDWTLVMEGE